MEIVFAFVGFLVFFLAMAIGYIVKGTPLKGSCGGVAALMGNEQCDICGGDMTKCEASQQDSKVDSSLAYPADSITKKVE